MSVSARHVSALALGLAAACRSTPANDLSQAEPLFTVVDYSQETTPQVNAYTDCYPDRPSMREDWDYHLYLREHSRLIIACLDVGRALAVVPTTRLESGELHPPMLVFAAAESLWFLAPDMDVPERYQLPSPLDDLTDFGSSLELTCDVDGDGVRDLIVGAISKSEDRWCRYVFSTARRRLLHRIQGVTGMFASCGVPDRDADGVDDLAVLSVSLVERNGAAIGTARVTLHSLATGSPLGVLAEYETRWRWSRDQLEYAPSGPTGSPALIVADDRLRAFDFELGAALWSHEYDPERQSVDEGLMLYEDVDGDGVRDWLVGVGSARTDTEVQLRSGRTGELIRVTRGLHSDTESGYCLAPYVDLDGDGLREALSTNLPFGSSVVVLSSRDGSALLEVNDPMNWSNGSFLDGSIDWDGKGLPDLVIGQDVRTCGGSAQEICIISMEDHCVLRSFTPASMTHYLVRD